jgi:regulation of enolase protein 1 (concanavalin A-like superfamily)
MMTSFTLPSLPIELDWQNSPQESQVGSDGSLSITAGEHSDWFSSPDGATTNSNAPSALFRPPDENFLLSAKVTVEFGSMYDAGVLRIHERDDLWAKACFEYSPQGQPMIVSVVTRGLSDDCNSVVIGGNTVYMRIAKNGLTFAIHYSEDGKHWHFVRYFTLGKLDDLRVGFSAQSPTGKQCRVVFSEIGYRAGVLADNRNGE